MPTFYICVFSRNNRPSAQSNASPSSVYHITSAAMIECVNLDEAEQIAFAIRFPKGEWDCSGFPEPSSHTKRRSHLQGLHHPPQVDPSAETSGEKEYLVTSTDEILKIWTLFDFAKALLRFDQWSESSDAQKNAPEHRECVFLWECVHLARIIHTKIQSLESNTPGLPYAEMFKPLEAALEENPFPYTEEDRKRWVDCTVAAKIEDVDPRTLLKYRGEGQGEKSSDGLAGRDRYGRIWRKPRQNAKTIYLLSSLLNFSSDDS